MVSHVLCTCCIVDLIICGCAERGVYVLFCMFCHDGHTMSPGCSIKAIDGSEITKGKRRVGGVQ